MKAFLSRFTPSLMTPEALEAVFVQREELAQRVIDLIRDSTLTQSKHHTLLIGPRGTGKTHLIALIYHRIKTAADLRDRMCIAWLREEEWGVASFRDLLLRVFRALFEESDDPGLAKRIESLYSLPPETAERAAGSLLKEFVGDRTLLVLMENLDDLFDGLGTAGQKRLRAYLQENPFWTIVATAQSLFNGVSLQTSPFYGFFRIHHLKELTLEDARQLLTKIAKLNGDTEVATFIMTPSGRARVRAVHHLGGGNHRVYVIFSEFLTRESLDKLVDPFMRTLDDLTPYYQARMAWLSPQQRKIVEFLCDKRHAVTVKDIAERCFITHQTASSQLQGLREMGYVRSIPVGRESYYELREPLMRLCIEVKRHRGEPLRLFIDFLRLWYSRTELQQRLSSLETGAVVEQEYVLHALHALENAEDPLMRACVDDLKASFNEGDFAKAFQAAEELAAIRGDAEDWYELGHCLAHLSRFADALEQFDKAVGLEPGRAGFWGTRAWALDELGRYEEALASIDKSIELEPGVAVRWLNRSVMLGHLGRHDEALTSVDKAIELRPSYWRSWARRGGLVFQLGRYDEALQSFDKAIELERQDWGLWLDRGLVLHQTKRYQEALVSFDKAIGLNSSHSHSWLHKAWVLFDVGRYDEALASVDKAIELNDRSFESFMSRAQILVTVNRWKEGCAVLDDVLSHFTNDSKSSPRATGAIVLGLFNSSRESEVLRERIGELIALYDKHQLVSVLAHGIVQGISALLSSVVSNEAARVWRDIWQSIAGERIEFQLPLRLLDAAIRYSETHDQRILLELPVEERTLLEPLLQKEPFPAKEPMGSLYRSTRGSRGKSRRISQRKIGSPG